MYESYSLPKIMASFWDLYEDNSSIAKGVEIIIYS